MFPWAVTFSSGLLVHAAAQAAKSASVPVSVHLDHAQDEALIRHCAENLPFDSIMVDMSHYEREENLAKTRELVAYCHERGIVRITHLALSQHRSHGVERMLIWFA